MDKLKWTEKIIYILVFIFFALLALSLIIPFLWLIMNSFKTDLEFRGAANSLPERWIFNNYYVAFEQTVEGTNMLGMLLNSVIMTVGVVIIGSFTNLLASYTMAKYKFKGNAFLYSLILIVMCIPAIGGTAFTFKFWHQIGIYDTFFSIFLSASGGFGSTFLLLYSSFKGVSWTYAEAAFMDGASNFRVFIQIMVPQIFPIVSAFAVLSALGTWNDYFTSYMYLPGHPTLAYGLYEIQSAATTKQMYPQLFAFMIICSIPMLIIFIFMQNTIMENVTTGGIKG